MRGAIGETCLFVRLYKPSESVQRRWHSKMNLSAEQLRQRYIAAKKAVACVEKTPRVDPRAVFANNELNLKRISVYGFDYDYTLAVYTREVNQLIYDLSMRRLIKKFKYPEGLRSVPYDPTFAIRGLHFDITNCCLLKMDAFSQIQKGTVHRGRRKLTDEEVMRLYSGFSVPDIRGRDFPQLMDLFSLPWAGLLSTVVQYFDDNAIAFDPLVMYADIAESVKFVHVSGELYASVTADVHKYIHRNEGLGDYLRRLHNAGKTLFMVTNSPFSFMNTGMTYMLGHGWRDLFAHIVVSARKPDFFHKKAPFRAYNEHMDSLSYEKVTNLMPGSIYAGGNINELSHRAGFEGQDVLYFGDHIYTDLAEPMLRLGWHTAAIVPELAREIRAQNDDSYRGGIQWLETLTALIERTQLAEDAEHEAKAVITQWHEERAKIREGLKSIFNPRFGSIFRTYHNMTYFSRRLLRLSDIYTSRLPNLNSYTLDHTFYPRRNALPHENAQHVPAVTQGMMQEIEKKYAMFHADRMIVDYSVAEYEGVIWVL